MAGGGRPAGRRLALLRLFITVLTFACIGWYLHTRPRLDPATLHLRWKYFAWATACTAPALALRARKWQFLLRGLLPDATFGQALRSFAGALSLGLITPGRLGELSRGWYLPQAAARGWSVPGLVLIDNWLDLLAVLAWACLGWMLHFGAWGLWFGLGAAVVFAPVRPWLRLAGRAAARLPRLRGAREAVAQGLAAGETVAGRDWRGAWAAAFAAFAFDWLQIALLIAFLSPSAPAPWRLAGLMALVTLANSFQITLAGVGVREGLAMILLAGEGVGAETALAATFLQTCLGQFLPALAGLAIRPAVRPEAPAPD